MKPLPTFNDLKDLIPLTAKRQNTVERGRLDVTNILKGVDKRFLVIAGPCSIHDYKEAIEVAYKISVLAERYKDKMVILMRVCLNKPRTKKDWCGYFNDPKLDGSCDMIFGYKNGRKLMSEIIEMGLPIACELLIPVDYHIVSDMVSYAWVGARTIASPETRNASSGLSVPVGIKNPNRTDDITDALNAIEFVTHPSTFSGPNDDGKNCTILTEGNPDPNLILRGGKSGPNYMTEKVNIFAQELKEKKLPENIIVDCSHGNCENDYERQLKVLEYLIDQRVKGLNPNVVGVMIESYLNGGKQDNGLKLGELGSKEKVKSRLSVTDACISESDLENALAAAYQKLS
jgi:3-deoxy-7-phosphoheptulonate synthase